MPTVTGFIPHQRQVDVVIHLHAIPEAAAERGAAAVDGVPRQIVAALRRRGVVRMLRIRCADADQQP